MSASQPRPEHVFVVLAALFGTAFVFATPPLDPADELRHFQRAYLLSEGDASPPGQALGYEGAIPRSLVEVHQPPYRWMDPSGRIYAQPVDGGMLVCVHDVDTLWAQFDDPLEPTQRRTLSSTTPQGPIAYLPQALALLPGRLLELPPVFLLYLGRLANVLTWVLVGWMAIRICPIRRWTLTLLCLSPMAVFLAGSLSADTPTNAASLFFIALVLRSAFPAEKAAPIDARQFAALVGTGALLGAMKPGYGVLTAAVLLIPAARFRTPLQRWSLIGAVPAATLAASVLWMLALLNSDQVFPNPNPEARFESLLESPLVFLERAVATFEARGWNYFRGFVGVLGHLDVTLPLGIYIGYPAALLAVTIFDGPDPREFNMAGRALLLGTFVLGTLVVLAQLYVGTGSPQSMVIPGMQGRHFIPLAPLLVLAIPARAPIAATGFAWSAAAASALCLWVAVGSLVGHYYR